MIWAQLVRLEELLESEELKSSFREWRAAAAKGKIEDKTMLTMAEHDVFADMIHTQSEDKQWVEEW